ncbi:outer membrane beta-barrel protein [Sinorhizobium sp. 8-89]|uniref:outer membrane protein n=1 Tax=Sinorhizobium sp. 7-81 TaxID=3049087 RepID=UPI0024C2A7F7|nr:outer membrane beta-barrel protein [Sinorhizobium sp. 7-81]MDK1388210.1 outer membrane beta-barrel protein [Sinorhizobium sp. 7-81]
MSGHNLSAGLAAGALLLCAYGVQAGDLTHEAASSNWSGCYVGAHAGYAHAKAEATDSPFTEGAFEGTGTSWNSLGAPYEVIESDDHAAIGGVEAGCDRQVDVDGLSLVFGGAIDFSLMDLSSGGASKIVGDTRTSFDTDWAGTARLRAGIAAEDLLFYVTGGLAVADIDVRAFDTQTFPTIGLMDVSGGGVKTGWVAGAGAEWRLAPNWSASLEYLHYDFDDVTATGAAIDPAGAFPRFENDLDFDVVRVGLRWRL